MIINDKTNKKFKKIKIEIEIETVEELKMLHARINLPASKVIEFAERTLTKSEKDAIYKNSNTKALWSVLNDHLKAMT